MTFIFFFIDQVALGIYIIFGVMILYFARHWLVARVEFRSTRFELERDIASQQQISAVSSVFMVAIACVMVLGVQSVVVPYLQSEETIQERAATMSQVREDGDFLTSTPAPLASGIDIEPVAEIGDSSGPILLLTPTLTPTPVGTIMPGMAPPEGCNDDRAMLQVPANGMRVFQPIRVIGTAYTDGFTVAKVEIQGPGTNNSYVVANEIGQPLMTMGDLTQFVPNYTEGVYQFRLMVFDLTNQPVASCMVNIFIGPPPTTPTPTPNP